MNGRHAIYVRTRENNAIQVEFASIFISKRRRGPRAVAENHALPAVPFPTVSLLLARCYAVDRIGGDVLGIARAGRVV